MSTPVAPHNVRIVLADGREVPVELVYAGRARNGQHEWVSAAIYAQAITKVCADMLPARTSVVIRTDQEEDPR